MSRRVDQAKWNVTVTWRGETRDLGTFDTMSGINATAENTKHRRGGMGKSRSLGGPSSLDDITVGRDYDLARDHGNFHWLVNANGKATFNATGYELDDDDREYGRPFILDGKIIEVHGPEHDSNSADVAMFELVLSPNDDLA
jgi:hypothetical protein